MEMAKAIKGAPEEYYALHFNLSRLHPEYRSDFQLKIAVNILNDVFRDCDGTVFLCRNGDIYVLYQGTDKGLIEKSIFQVRYLFIDDPLAAHPDGTENDAFCATFDLTFQWQQFYKSIPGRMTSQIEEQIRRFERRGGDEKPKNLGMTAVDLVKVEDGLETIDISSALRQQPVCAERANKDLRIVFNEMYVHIAHLNKLLGGRYQLAQNRGLFKYLTQQLDRYILQHLASRPNVYLARPLSLNLNVETVTSPMFEEFCKEVKRANTPSLVIEMQISDVFMDMNAFREGRRIAQNYGYRVCVDGLTNESFVQVDRAKLGFDLAKLQWNADLAGDLDTPENQQLAKAIEACGSNRMILCRCETHHAVEYGRELGISLFQGRYTDRVLNPDAVIEN